MARGRSITIQLNTHNQNIEALHRLVARVGGLAGCDHCGRMALLRIDLLGDPPPDMAKEGAVSFIEVGG
jgi:hypothetical protein